MNARVDFLVSENARLEAELGETRNRLERCGNMIEENREL
jgi:hypothetical protein